MTPVLATSVLSVEGLVIEADGVRLVDGVSFEVLPEEVLCIVGESGSGKSLTLLAVMGLLPAGVRVTAGRIRLGDQDLRTATGAQLRALRGRSLAMVFQDPMTSFNPVLRIGRQLAEAVRLHSRGLSRCALRARAVELLAGVRIPDPAARAASYPHELSGGMRQRAMIAMATAHEPELLLADEPTTALDVTVQAQVLDLLREMRRRCRSSMVLVTHDLGLVAENADRVLVMYAGRIVEAGTLADIFTRARHPYTVGLLASAMHLDVEVEQAYAVPGQPPSPAERPVGCVFEPRCALSQGRERCRTAPPPLVAGPDGSASACWYSREVPDWTRREFPQVELEEAGRA